MAIKLAGYTMPTSMSARAANYLFEPAEIIGRNGENEDIESAAGASLIWEWAHLNLDEWKFLYTTVLGGAASINSSAAGNTVIYNNQNEEVTFNQATVHRPHYKILTGGDYQQVTILIDNLRM